MKVNIYAAIKFEIEVDRATLDALMELSRDHYDGTCRRASDMGGFLYGWYNQLPEVESTVITASWSEVDLTLKLCELAQDKKTLPVLSVWMLTMMRAMAIARKQEWRVENVGKVPRFISCS